MKNTLSDLNNYLFEALERLTETGISIAKIRTIMRSKNI